MARNTTFLRKLMDTLSSSIGEVVNNNSKVVQFKDVPFLRGVLKLEIPNEGLSDDQLMDRCQKILQYSVTSNNSHFYNQLFGSTENSALGGAVLTEFINNSAYTFEVAPVNTVIEQELFSYIGNLFGYTESDGIFCPGGSIANMYALSMARHQRYPGCREKGMKHLPDLRIYTSELSHYSLKKGVMFMGFGTDSLVQIDCNDDGTMNLEKLNLAIVSDKKEGFVPFLVCATAGTTVFGAFDDIQAISEVAKRHELWLHVDGCLGASVILSETHKHLLNGVEMADSITWNQHKMLGVPLQCASLVTKHVGLLESAHAVSAAYLFQPDKFYDTALDTGDKSIQCGRKIDGIKLWLLWQALGKSGLEKYIDRKIALAKQFAEMVEKDERFILIIEPVINNICFYYLPTCLRNVPQDTPEFKQRLHNVAPILKKNMTFAGNLMVGYNPQKDLVNFWRLVMSQVDNTEKDLRFILEEFDKHGAEIQV